MGQTGEGLTLDFDKPRENCGVFGIFAPGEPVADMTYDALDIALQGRGSDGAGIAVSRDHGILVIKDLGRVEKVFDSGKRLSGFGEGDMASGHVRYSTIGIASYREQFNALHPQGPMNVNGFEFVRSDNGHVINVDHLRSKFGLSPTEPMTDSGVVIRCNAKELEAGRSIEEAVGNVALETNGAWASVLMTCDQLIGTRDSVGFRPLKLGETDKGGLILASEKAAIDVIGGRFLRDIRPGEMVVITEGEMKSVDILPKHHEGERHCALEAVYFARPDQVINGENVSNIRFRCGEALARLFPVEADGVLTTPDSGTSAAQGYAFASHLRMREGIIKNRLAPRTFILETLEKITKEVRRKHNINDDVVEGKDWVVVDDSIVRGSTQKRVIRELRAAGARRIHLRIASAMMRWPCHMGIYIPNQDNLIAWDLTKEEVCSELEVDSLEFLPIEELQKAAGKAGSDDGKKRGLCDACMTGEYPIPVPVLIGKTQ